MWNNHLPAKFRRSENSDKQEEKKYVKCYSLQNHRLLKFVQFHKQHIHFKNNYYMDFKDMLDLEFLYNIFKRRKLDRRIRYTHYTL